MDIIELVASMRAHYRCTYRDPMNLAEFHGLLTYITTIEGKSKHELYEHVMRKHLDGYMGIPELLVCVQYIDYRFYD